MKSKKRLIFGLLVVILGIFSYFEYRNMAQEAVNKKLEGKLASQVNFETLERIKFESPTNQFMITKKIDNQNAQEQETWQISIQGKEKEIYLASRSKVRTFLRGLTHISVQTLSEVKNEKISNYGFDEKNENKGLSLKVTLFQMGSVAPLKFYFSALKSYDGGLYIKHKETLFVSNSSFLPTVLNYSHYDFLNLQLTGHKKDWKEVSFSTSKTKYTLLQKEPSKWSVHPQKWDLNFQKVDYYLGKVLAAKAESVVSNEKLHQKTLKAAQKYTLILKGPSSERTLKLMINKKQQVAFARVSDRRWLFKVNFDVAKGLIADLDSFRDRVSMFQKPYITAQKIEFQSAKSKSTLIRSGETWSLGKKTLKLSKVSNYLKQLTSLKVKTFLKKGKAMRYKLTFYSKENQIQSLIQWSAAYKIKDRKFVDFKIQNKWYQVDSTLVGKLNPQNYFKKHKEKKIKNKAQGERSTSSSSLQTKPSVKNDK